jgi:hypothetical protein
MGGDMSSVRDKFHAASSASSAAFVDADDAPVFFYNGSAGQLVPQAWTKTSYFALKSAGVKTAFCSLDNAGHMQAAANQKAFEKACSFLESELVPDAEAVATLEKTD